MGISTTQRRCRSIFDDTSVIAEYSPFFTHRIPTKALNMKTRTLVAAAAILAVALSAGCSDAGAPPSTAPMSVDGRIPVFAAAAGSKSVLPNGKGLDVALDPSPPSRAKNKIEYHGGPVLTFNAAVYFIWYGAWGSDEVALKNQLILTDLASEFCGRPYTDMWRAYTDTQGRAPLGCILYAGGHTDAYSHGTTLSDADVADIVRNQLATNGLPQDPGGVYIVVTSADVAESSGFGVSYCGWHGRTEYDGSTHHIGFLGWPERAPANCAPNGVGPNGTVGADAAASHFVGLLSDMVTDPDFAAWYDKLGLEMADKCVWTYGTTYKASNGSRANVRFGSRDYLLQQLWVPSKTGGACGLHP